MLTGAPSCRRLLVVEHDLATLEMVEAVLLDEGYAVMTASSLELALALIAEHVFDFILTDLFTSSTREPFAAAGVLRNHAYPTPVGLMTGWSLSPQAVKRAGFACLVNKPFEIDTLLATIASCVSSPLKAAQERREQIVNAYFAALSDQKWDRLRGLCTDDFTFYPPDNTPFATAEPIRGLEPYLAFAREVQARLPGFRFDALATYACPEGVAARYGESWLVMGGTRNFTTGAAICAFAGERLCQVRVQISAQQLQRLLAHTTAYRDSAGA